jgi:hypothetical protein
MNKEELKHELDQLEKDWLIKKMTFMNQDNWKIFLDEKFYPPTEDNTNKALYPIKLFYFLVNVILIIGFIFAIVYKTENYDEDAFPVYKTENYSLGAFACISTFIIANIMGAFQLSNRKKTAKEHFEKYSKFLEKKEVLLKKIKNAES